MSSSRIDPLPIDNHSRQATTRRLRRLRIIQSAIVVTIAASCLLDMSTSTTTTNKRKNAKWDEEIEVFQMMEYFVQHESSAERSTGNFKAQVYNGAAAHIAQYRPAGTEPKTADQVENKYRSVRPSDHDGKLHVR